MLLCHDRKGPQTVSTLRHRGQDETIDYSLYHFYCYCLEKIQILLLFFFFAEFFGNSTLIETFCCTVEGITSNSINKSFSKEIISLGTSWLRLPETTHVLLSLNDHRLFQIIICMHTYYIENRGTFHILTNLNQSLESLYKGKSSQAVFLFFLNLSMCRFYEFDMWNTILMIGPNFICYHAHYRPLKMATSCNSLI